MTVRIGFLAPGNIAKETKIDFLSQILRKFCRMEDLAHLAQAAILGGLKVCLQLKKNMTTGFRDPHNLGKDTTIDFNFYHKY